MRFKTLISILFMIIIYILSKNKIKQFRQGGVADLPYRVSAKPGNALESSELLIKVKLKI